MIIIMLVYLVIGLMTANWLLTSESGYKKHPLRDPDALMQFALATLVWPVILLVMGLAMLDDFIEEFEKRNEED